MATCAEKQAWLAAAETALHALQTGSKIEIVRIGEKSMQYTAANVTELRKYVQQLTDQVNACTGASTLRRRIIGIIPQG